MVNDKQTEENEEMNNDDSLNRDDVEMLREVLHDVHSHGIMPVSVYCQADFDGEE